MYFVDNRKCRTKCRYRFYYTSLDRPNWRMALVDNTVAYYTLCLVGNASAFPSLDNLDNWHETLPATFVPNASHRLVLES